MILENNLNFHKNRIEDIKNLKSYDKRIAIGSLIHDIGGRCLNKISKLFNVSWAYCKKCYIEYSQPQVSKPETRGRKKLTELQPTLIDDIKNIIEDYASTDSDFKTEKRYVRLTLNEIREELIATKHYTNETCIKKSALANLLNELNFNLRKVQKTKPLKKIPETDATFDNVHNMKKAAYNDDKIALLSLDTKDKVLLGPFSRNGKNRFDVKAVDHDLTNNCLIPFGILDLKTNIPYFFNFTTKPTSCDLVDCIEEWYQEKYLNSDINKIVILLDNGPDNSGVRTIFLKWLIQLSNKYNIEIELVYYPPYHSKYNPVERLWARLENIWNGSLLETKEICLGFMKNLTWKSNKSVTKLKEVKYEKGMKVEKQEMKELENNYIIRDEELKK